MQFTTLLLAALPLAVLASPVDILTARDGGITIPAETITLPTIALPTLTIPGAVIPTAITIPGFSTEIPLPSICPTALDISLPAATLALPALPTITISKVITVTAGL